MLAFLKIEIKSDAGLGTGDLFAKALFEFLDVCYESDEKYVSIPRAMNRWEEDSVQKQVIITYLSFSAFILARSFFSISCSSDLS
jgi:hypothetical protein